MDELNKTYLTLEKIDEATVHRRIHVRLLRLWEARNPRKGNQLMSLDLLLLDEKDNLIKASVNYRLISKFNSILREGSVYQIEDFDIARSKEKYRITEHDYTIYFNQMTKISEVGCSDSMIKKTKFRVQGYDNLLKIANTNEELPDVIGKIVFILGSNLRDTKSTGRITTSLILEDGSKVRLSIWDNIASDFRGFLKTTNRKKKIVIVTAVNPKIISGEIYLNTTAATRFCIQDDLPEVVKYMAERKMETTSTSPMNEREMEPKNLSLTTISNMLSFLETEQSQDKVFYCEATIIDILTRNGWNYVSCSKCLKKLIKEESKFKCPQCNDANVIGIVRYRLEVMVEDDTERGTFIIFDKDGRQLTNTLASELASVEGEVDEPGGIIPACIQDLKGQAYVFEVTVKPFDFKAIYKTFTVTRVINKCFEQEHEPVDNKIIEEEYGSNKVLVKNNNQYVKRKNKEDNAISHADKKAKSQGKKLKQHK